MLGDSLIIMNCRFAFRCAKKRGAKAVKGFTL
jgi:hypothetical protein